MLQLIYMSAASHPMTDKDMHELRDQAALRNVGSEITGVLLIRNDRFLQALEGPRETVEDTFLRIIRDPRHHSLLILSRRMTIKRQFGDWSMALDDTEGDAQATISAIGQLVEDAPLHLRAQFAAAFQQSGPHS